MVAPVITKNGQHGGITHAPRWNTYITSPFILLAAFEKGWKIVTIKLAPSGDQTDLVFLVTMKSESYQLEQTLILPRNVLVEKILAEHSQGTNPAQAIN
ncbi:MAG TPA: hypothetical protein VMT91_15190 [Anaerolineales bacterium]|nr:hypothetical protein [Anaerolineales bacterium]